MESRKYSGRPYTNGSFQVKLNQFQQFIKDFTHVDAELNLEERRQQLQAKLFNGYEPFCEAIRGLFGNDVSTQDLKALFRKIASNPDAEVDWSELFGIGTNSSEIPDLLLSEDSSSIFLSSQRKTVGEAGGDKKRRDTIQSIAYVPKFDFFVVASQKGIICHWSSKFRLQACTEINETSWITGIDYLPNLRRIIITSERSISLWDHRAKRKQATIIQVRNLENAPQCITYIPWNTRSMLEDSVLFGDDQGYVNLLTVSSKDLHMKSSDAKDSKIMALDANKLNNEIKRRKFHDDWVVKVKYFPQLQMFGSCSPSSNVSFVLGDLERIFDNNPMRELSIPKGINCFDYCAKANVIATAGTDKIIRVWHPLIFTRPTGKLIGHLFTIIEMAVNEKDQHLISLSTARVFRVWDIQVLTCLQVFTDSDTQPGDKRVTAMLFDSKHDRLVTGSGVLDVWPLTRAIQDSLQVPQTHDRPLCQLMYNPYMNQVVSACNESVIKMWEMETGQLVYQITDAHGSGIEITAINIDTSGYRLVTGAYDGSVKVWDFGSGQLYKGFKDESKTKEYTITGLVYHKIGNKRCILAASWGKKIRLLEDPYDSPVIVELRVLTDVFQPPPAKTITPQEEEDHYPFVSRFPAIGERQDLPPRENVLAQCEVSCMDCLSPLLVAGTTEGSLVLWNLEDENVVQKFDFPQRHSGRRSSKKPEQKLVHSVKFLVYRIRRPIVYAASKKLEAVKEQQEEEDNETRDSHTLPPRSDVSTSRRSGTRLGTGMETRSDGRTTKQTLPESAEIIKDNKEDASESGKTKTEVDEETEKGTKEEQEAESKDDVSADEVQGDDNPEFLRICDPVIVSSHYDGYIRFWNFDGKLLNEIRALTRRTTSSVTAICSDADCNYLVSADAKGYITVWDVRSFLEDPLGDEIPESDKEDREEEPKNAIKQMLCWRAHLSRIVGLEHVAAADVIISASTDCSVRVWYRDTGHFIGFFSQPRLWHLPSAKSVPSTPVRPYDIGEVPLKMLKHTKTKQGGKQKDSHESAECPLVFDNQRWQPFRHSAKTPIRSPPSKSPNSMKFFDSLSKPKHYNSHLESWSTATPEMGAVYRALPVYRVETPERLKTPAINRSSSWLTNPTTGKQTDKGMSKMNYTTYRTNSTVSEKPVVRFPHLVLGPKR